MANWDELRDKFAKDAHAARIDKERAVQSHNLVEGSRGNLWRLVQNEANAAVESVNASSSQTILLLRGTEGKTEFTIIYNRADVKREARAALGGNQISANVMRPGNRSGAAFTS